MPTIKVKHTTSNDAPAAFEKIKEFFQTDDTLKKLDPKMSFTFEEAKHRGQAKGSQFKADFSIIPDKKGSSIEVVVELPFLLTPFKGKIEETIQKKLQKYMA